MPTDKHQKHNGPDHIWQIRRKSPFQKTLIRVDYACVCGAERTSIRYAEPGEVIDSGTP